MTVKFGSSVKYGGGRRFAEYDFPAEPYARVSYKSRGLGDFIVKEGLLTITDEVEPEIAREFRRLNCRIKNMGGGTRTINITVGKEIDNYESGVDFILDEFSAFSSYGESGTLLIYTSNENQCEQTGCWFVGLRVNMIVDKYCELEYSFRRSLV